MPILTPGRGLVLVSPDVLAFEYAARIAVDNNTILMLLRFLNQDMAVYMSTITEIAPYRYAPCPELASNPFRSRCLMLTYAERARAVPCHRRFLNYCTHPREDLTESDLAQTGQSQKGPAPPAPSRRTPVAENNDDDSTGEAAASQASRDGPVPVRLRGARRRAGRPVLTPAPKIVCGCVGRCHGATRSRRPPLCASCKSW